MEEINLEFQYLVAANAPFLVVTFVGPMDKNSLDMLALCEKEIMMAENIKYVVLYFRDVPVVTADVIPFFTALQMKIRAQYTLKICSLRPEVKEKLTKLGIIRGLEVCNNLQEALQVLKSSAKK
jgi:hypothetical protein